MVSVPRDLWVAIPGHGQERINAAFELGGSQTAKQTVSNVLGQRVDRYAVIGLQGVRDVVDAVGGVDITVAQAIHDDTYPTDDYGFQTVDIPAGRQHMDGDTALKYARTRHQDSDFGRIARQQQVLAAVRTRAAEPGQLAAHPGRRGRASSQSIQTDLSPLDAIAIGAAVLRDRAIRTDWSSTPRSSRPITGEGGAYLLEPKPELKADRRALPRRQPTAASVEILNGAGVAGLAARTADRLTQRGFVIASVGDAPQSPTADHDRRPHLAPAAPPNRSPATLGVPAARVTESASLGTADVQVILGADAR